MPDGAPVTPGSGLGVATDEVPVNLTGTVSKAGTTALTGSSTAFLTELSVGMVVRVPGGGGTEDRIIQAITSDTAATVTAAFANTASGQTGQRVQHAQLFKLAVDANGSAVLVPADATNGLWVNVKAGTVGHDTTGIDENRKVVTTAGTRVALASSTAAKWVAICAETDNTGIVVVGSAAGVIAALATREGFPLGPGESITIPVDNLADIGLDSTVSGDGVTFIYGT